MKPSPLEVIFLLSMILVISLGAVRVMHSDELKCLTGTVLK